MARLLLEAIRRSGNDVSVASTLRAYDGAGDTDRQNRIRRRGEALARQFIERNRENPPDIWFTYHLYHKAPDWIGPLVCDAFAIPYIIAEASIAPKQAGGPWTDGLAAVTAAVRGASRVIVLNPVDRECIEPFTGPGSRIVALPPFIDTGPPRRAAADRQRHRTTLAARHGVAPTYVWIAVSAMMRFGDKLESYRVLGRVMQGLRDLPLRWLVAGDGPARADVEALLGADVTYLGALGPHDMDMLHAAADFAVWPAMREAFGMAMLEAQAAGAPVIAGRSPGVAQIIADGETGILTPPGDDMTMAAAIRALAKDPERQRSMGRAAMFKAEREHDIAAAAIGIGRLLREAVS
ncbi:MAG: glycosyltransferase family 4 protein [Alphaproteobacteria bacterium]